MRSVWTDCLNLLWSIKEWQLSGITHFQAAESQVEQLLWLQSLLLDSEELEFRDKILRFRGVKGTTGTQAMRTF